MVQDVLSQSEEKMKKAVAAIKSEFAGVRTGRASAFLFDRINVDYYGTKTLLKQMASISTPEAQLAIIQPWDKSAIGAIEKAIMMSDLGVNPSNDGNVVRVPFPPLSEERRKDFVKLVKKMAEEGKVGVRNVRHEARDDLKDLEDEKMISEDDRKRAEKKVDELTEKYVKEIDALLHHKEKEIMEV
ncbi:MAG: ribosome recycling factor [Candidatus Aquicultor secundus]|uniref:Ribosome-recycling factor n=1 Tax=Candidatus Aquicultor secundus TaxID=1973895 RepID=A0A2M7T6S4_9ACTN|nr:ribosome recycling factor [Candidatus Aquicultor secundus]NCO66618.1 ribosome recycling factor [Solirubrobacter sp.]OIO88447.1 MAG: ribosome recycling factor [Candidatus Aquicultor secundus]PIU26271.1 MAG: ribosome recycling factor [Candidatus Aquicultor secundus]PIW22278.1 MAG: ribosome recycling factor [Candidatus Aquicultor secundus]PIX51425.1 MAG: ribosome recycling factor [Candidatus Aquicultor secundus]